MLRCDTTFDENPVPPWTRGDFRGVWGSDPQPLTPALCKESTTRLSERFL